MLWLISRNPLIGVLLSFQIYTVEVHIEMKQCSHCFVLHRTKRKSAAAQDALNGSSAVCGEDGRWQVNKPQSSEKVEMLLGFHGTAVEG